MVGKGWGGGDSSGLVMNNGSGISNMDYLELVTPKRF